MQVENLVDRLMQAEASRVPIAPISDEFANSPASAYAVQSEWVRRGIAAGRRLVGRKIGLTSQAVQRQLGVDQPDYGALFADMEVVNGGICRTSDLIQPRIEAEIALVLDRDLGEPDVTVAELIRAVDFVVPALEIVDSRIENWKIAIGDTIADNGSSARFVLGMEPKSIRGLDLETCGMLLTRDGEPVSVGSGAACLGHPIKAALWLARTMAEAGTPLQAGDVVLTGALGPMCDAKPGNRFEARIGGFCPVSVQFE
jgi:2-keto-4-pentenoate hydratase